MKYNNLFKKHLSIAVIIVCILITVVFTSGQSIPTYPSGIYNFNTAYGQLTLNVCEGNGIVALNQDVNKTWYLSGYWNGRVNPDKVYFSSYIQFLDASNNVLASTTIFSWKQIDFSIPYPDLYSDDWNVVRQLNCIKSGQSSISYTFPANVLSSTKTIRFCARYNGWWDSNHWTDGNVCEMNFYENYPPLSVSEHIENFPFTFNKLPEINVQTPIQNQIFTGSDILVPTFSISDTNNDSLSCLLYLDNDKNPIETKVLTNTLSLQTLSFAGINTSLLRQGGHIVRLEVNDGKNIAKKNIPIKVDRSEPLINNLEITSTSNSITINVSASDSISGLDSNAYQYTVAGIVSQWKTDTYHTQGSLAANTEYSIELKIKDKKDNTKILQKKYWTKP